MENINIYHLIKMCAFLVAAWCVQIVGFSSFKTEVNNGSPTMHIVDFDKEFSSKDSDRPLVDLGYDMSVPFVSADEAEKRIAEHQRKKWLGLLIGMLGAIEVFLTAYKLWGDWIIGIVCVLMGPLGIAWGIQRSNQND